MRTVFLGNDDTLIGHLDALPTIDLVGIVAEERSEVDERYFGSALEYGRANGIPVISPSAFHGLGKVPWNAEFAFCQGYCRKIPKSILDWFPRGIVNFHQSLLPDLAGRHPLNWAIVRGDEQTGVTLHYMAEDFDAGPILAQEEVAISVTATVIEVYRSTILAGQRLLPQVVQAVQDGSRGVPQVGERRYYSPRSFADGEIHPGHTCRQVFDLIRALVYPYPGAWVKVGGEIVVVDSVRRVEAERADDSLYLKQQDGVLEVTSVRGREELAGS